MKTVTILEGQTVTDIAVQELGDAERSMEIAVMNNISITDDLIAGSFINVPDYDASKQNYVQLFANSANKPASADSSDENGLLTGIGYWYLENDFIIQ